MVTLSNTGTKLLGTRRVMSTTFTYTIDPVDGSTIDIELIYQEEIEEGKEYKCLVAIYLNGMTIGCEDAVLGLAEALPPSMSEKDVETVEAGVWAWLEKEGIEVD